MPKPTTHTDIVIITKEDPSTGAPASESIQLTLVADGTIDNQSKCIGHDDPIHTPSQGLLEGQPTGLRVSVGTRILKLAYAARVEYVADDAGLRNGPALLPQQAESAPSTHSFTWKSTANGALVKVLKLSIFATLDGTKLDVQDQRVSTTGTQRLELKFFDGRAELGELVMTAAMEALPAL